MVLAALEAGAQAPRRPQGVGAHGREVVDVVLAVEQFPVEIRLEMRLEPAPPPVDLVLVAVDEDEAGILAGGADDFVEGVGGEDVVVVHEGAPRAAGHGQRVVGGPRDVAVLRPPMHADARIVGGGAGEEARDRRIGRGVVDGAELPMGVDLRAQGGEGGPQHLGGGLWTGISTDTRGGSRHVAISAARAAHSGPRLRWAAIQRG